MKTTQIAGIFAATFGGTLVGMTIHDFAEGIIVCTGIVILVFSGYMVRS
jgi:hypothetical protein